MALKVFPLVVLCFSPLITQIKAECSIHTSQDAKIKPIFFRNYKHATSLITNITQGIRLDGGERIIGRCHTIFDNYYSQDITIYCGRGYFDINDKTYSQRAILNCLPGNILGTCDIDFPADKAVRPKLFKKFGTRTAQVIPETQTTIQNDQELIAKCDTKFKSPNNESKELNLTCLNGKMIALGYPYYTKYDYLECESLKLYESSTQFPWCPSTMVSYLLAHPSAQEGSYEYFAGICFNLEQMSFKSLYYATQQNLEKYKSPNILKSFEPLVEITDIDVSFISKKTYSNENAQAEIGFPSSKLKNGPILQNPRLYFYMLQSYYQLLNIDWWPGLQWGNWHRYEAELVKHVENDGEQFELLAGVSPPYVWNYLKSLENSSNNVVVIGVNSLVSDFFAAKNFIFCEDICHKIYWLANAHLTFDDRLLGVIFCCKVEDAAWRLEGFAVPAEPKTPS